MRLVVAPAAESDFEEIIRASAAAFGEVAAHRYRLLIQQAYVDVLARARRIGSASPAMSWSIATTRSAWRSSAFSMTAWTCPRA